MSFVDWWRERFVGPSYAERNAAANEWARQNAIPAPPTPKIPCTCGSVHFTAGGAVVSPTADGHCGTTGAILCCVRCGRRWAQCGGELVEPHGKAMPPAWAAVDLHEAMQARDTADRPATKADFARLRGATRRASYDSLRTPPGREA